MNSMELGEELSLRHDVLVELNDYLVGTLQIDYSMGLHHHNNYCWGLLTIVEEMY